MTYINGLVIPVLAGNSREAYAVFARKTAPIFKDHGATRAWKRSGTTRAWSPVDGRYRLTAGA